MEQKKESIEVFELICAYGNKTYAFKTYENGKIIGSIKNMTKKRHFKTNKSHGICPDCLPNVYMSIGLIPKYNTIDNKINTKVEEFKNYSEYIEKENPNYKD
jgi:hypothetical protein